MPLSEQEQRLLDEMERNLYRNDTDFVSTSHEGRARPSYRSITIGALVFVVGVIGLVVGVMVPQPLIGLAAFVIMLGGVIIAMTPSKRQQERVSAAPMPRSSNTGSVGSSANGRSFMDKMNDRWDRRNES